MRRLLIPAAVVVIGLLAGAAVAGLPTSVADDVAAEEIDRPEPSTTTTSQPASPITQSGAERTASTSTSTSSTSSTSTSTSSIPATTSTSSMPATTASSSLVSPDELRVVVVNASGVRGVGALVAGGLRGLGYTNVTAIDAAVERDTSAVAYLPGFDDEALTLAVQQAVGDVVPRAVEPLPLDDATADVWLFVGSDLL